VTPVIFVLVSWLAIQIFTLNCAEYVQRRAIAVRLNAKSMITTTVSAALNLVGAVLSLAVKWRSPCRKGTLDLEFTE
jgi:Na+-transporting NADH:ubiquinone oxidoreductase subunit NqrF